MEMLFFIVFMLMHIAFALAIAFFVLYLAEKSLGLIRNLGLFTGWLLIILAILAMITGIVFAAKKPSFSSYSSFKSEHNRMMKNNYMNPKNDNDKDDENDKNNKENKNAVKTGGACPLKVE